jgi:pyrroloquinoline quinone biosynthesis protein B
LSRSPLAAFIAIALFAACTPAHRDAATLGTNDPYVVVLGTAQDGGIPHAGCTCSHCKAATTDAARRRNVASLAIFVPSSGQRFLIDATPDLRAQLERLPDAPGHTKGKVDRHPVDGVLLTHAHIGHYLGLAFFGFEAIHTSGLPVYATPRMAEFLRTNAPWSRLVSREEIELRESPPGAAFELAKGIRVTPFAVPHRDEDSDTVGFALEGAHHTLVYVPDTDGWAAWSEEALAMVARCDTLLVDGTFYAAGELPGRDVGKIGHPLMTDTMDRLGARVREGRLRVVFTHLNHSNGAVDPEGPERRAVKERGFAVAEDGQRLPL